MYLHTYIVHIYIHTYMYTRTYIYVYIRIDIYICIYIYVYAPPLYSHTAPVPLLYQARAGPICINHFDTLIYTPSQVENSWLGTLGLLQPEPPEELALIVRAISSNCMQCAKLWQNLGRTKLRAGATLEAQRCSQTAFRLGLHSSAVRSVLADALDAQHRTPLADNALVAMAIATAKHDALEAAQEYLALFIRFASRGCCIYMY